MSVKDFVVMIVIGALAGWGAGQLMGSSFSLLWNIILGIAGGVIGGALLGKVLTIFKEPLLNRGLIALVGSCILLLIGRLLVSLGVC